jgi:hypothetical protein
MFHQRDHRGTAKQPDQAAVQAIEFANASSSSPLSNITREFPVVAVASGFEKSKQILMVHPTKMV